MMTGPYRFAGKCIAITSVYEAVHRLCRAYRTEGPPELFVRTGPSDIAYEREKARSEGAFPDDYLETLAVYRRIAELLVQDDTLLFHGSVVAVDGTGYLFTAKSGTGKSTHTRLWREVFKERAVMVNDDKPLLHITEKGVLAYGTPWDGKHRLSSNICVPLRAVCLLERAEENRIVPITKQAAYPMLLQQAYRPQQAELLARVLALTERLADKTALYRLGCNMEPEAALIAWQAMKGEAS